jgi:hypothetical protein
MIDKIKISSHLLLSALNFLEGLDTDDIPHESLPLYGYVLFSLKKKSATFSSDQYFDDDLPF